MPNKTCALVLAAGKGTRMHCEARPKVMIELLGEPMLWYVYDALSGIFGDEILTVVGFRADVVRQAFPGHEGRFVHQEEQLGTGHALSVAWNAVKARGCEGVVVVNGDTPLLQAGAMQRFVSRCESAGADFAFMSITPPQPNAFGRVVRDAGGCVTAIVEAKDYDESVYGPATGEVNAGIYYMRVDAVEPLLSLLSNENRSGEFYITDLVELSLKRGLSVIAVECGDDASLMGVNSPVELAEAEERLRARIVRGLLGKGVIVRSPASVRVGPKAVIAPGAEICGPCDIVGDTIVESGVRVDAHTWIDRSELMAGCHVRHFSHLENAYVGENSVAGPYVRLRPGAVMQEESKVGNFVEMKKAVLGRGSKASHLTYLGDAEIGDGVNIGAGTITCNYDGKNKFKTVIRDGAFIGSNTALVAPVEIGEKSLVGAGSTITKDVADGKVVVARGKQIVLKRGK